MKNVLKTGKSKRVEFRLPYNGTNHFYEAVIVPEKGENNNHSSILCIVRDVTSNKRSENQNKRLLKDLEKQKNEMEVLLARDKTLLENLNEGVIISDPYGELIYMNEASKCFS
ncbi:MAG: hypothetical protein HC906_09180 [Bacteroidales bacterium]|nr:hypothetical protein [Bacteroidales bacterium]